MGIITLYRYFDEEKYALKAIDKGLFRVKPLTYYRRIEDINRKDAYDGMLYVPDVLVEIKYSARSCYKGMAKNFSVMDHVPESTLFILCTSMSYSKALQERFGKYVVKIELQQNSIWDGVFESGIIAQKDHQILHGEVFYYSMLPTEKIPLCFLKPAQGGYEVEQEYRFVLPLNSRLPRDELIEVDFRSMGSIMKIDKCW